MKFAIGLVRVSTNKQFENGDSIDTQQTRIEYAADRDGYVIARWFVEHYSGRKAQRHVIDEILVYLKDNKDDITAVYIGQIDRLTRAGADTYLRLRKELFNLGVEIIDAYGVIQKTQNTLAHVGFSYDWSNRAPSRMAEVIMAEQAHAEATDILTRTVGQEIKLVQMGYHVRPANIGYKNAKVISDDGKKRPIMVPHEIESKWLIAMFDLRADGQFSDQDICDRVNVMGFKTRKIVKRHPQSRKVVGYSGEIKLNPKRLERYICNPIYCGVRVEKWTHYEPVRTPFTGLVSIDTFNKANRGKVFIHEKKGDGLKVEKNYRGYRRSLKNTDFVLRHFVMCSICGKPLMGSYSTNRIGKPFGYYHCDRGHKRYSIKKDVFESAVGYCLKRFQLKPAFLGLFKEAVREVWLAKNAQAETEVRASTQHIQELRDRQDLLLSKLEQVSSPIVMKKLEDEIEAIETSIKGAKDHRSKFEIGEDQIEEFFQYAKSVLEHPGIHAEKLQSKHKLEKLWRFIFADYPSFEKINSGTPNLSLIYRLNANFTGDKNQLVGQLGLNWNTFEKQVTQVLDCDIPSLIGKTKNNYP